MKVVTDSTCTAAGWFVGPAAAGSSGGGVPVTFLVKAAFTLAESGKSLPPHEAAIGNPENPRRFPVLPEWVAVLPHPRAGAMDGFSHGQSDAQQAAGTPVRLLPADAPPLLSGDRTHDDPAAGLRYPSDFSGPKPFGEVILVGSAYPPGGFTLNRYPARLRLGSWSKEILVFGDRRWDSGGLFDRPGAAGPAAAVPLHFSQSWGGRGHPGNPLGVGPEGDRLPLLELPGRPVTGRKSRLPPAGFGPVPADWRQRSQYCGLPEIEGLWHWWPWRPTGFDARFWMTTLPDQWVEGFFRGDEPVELEHLHPDHRLIQTQLPAKRARCFLLRGPDRRTTATARRQGVPPPAAVFEELPLVLDTIYFDMDAMQLLLSWRGTTHAANAKLSDIQAVVHGLEDLAENREPACYRALLEPEAPPSEPVPAAGEILADIEAALAEGRARGEALDQEIETQMAELQARAAAAIDQSKAVYEQAVAEITAGMPADAAAAFRKANAFPDLVQAAAAPLPTGPELATSLRQQADRLVQTAVDPDGNPLPALTATADQLRQLAAELEPVGDLGAGFAAEVAAFRQELEASFPADMLAARKIEPGMPLDLEAIHRDGLADFDLRGVDFSGCDLSGVVLRGVAAAGASFRGTNLSGADLSGADLSQTDLAEADLTGAILEGADLTDAQAAGATWRQAAISNCRLAGLTLTAADFTGSSGRWADFSGADLRAANFSNAQLEQPDFSGATIDRAGFGHATLPKADFRGASCRETGFEFCQLANLRADEETDFTQARFTGSNADNAAFSAALLDSADFQDADLRRADFSECWLERANFDRCDLAEAVFADSMIAQAAFTSANLLRTTFDRAVIAGSSFAGSSLFEASFWESSISDTNFRDAVLDRANLPARTRG